MKDDIKAEAKNIVKQKLEGFFRDKITAPMSDFEKAADKYKRISSGYIGKRVVDGAVFMIKPGLKGNDFENINPKYLQSKRDEKDDFMREYIVAPLFRRHLYDRAPIVEMIKKNDPMVAEEILPNTPDQLYVRSKFLDDFQPLDAFIEKNSDKLGKLQGFEKTLATCIFAGDGDYHGENLGVITKKLENGQEEYSIAKIDHGKSGMMFNDNEAIARQQLYTAMAQFNYDSIPLNVTKLKDAVNEITKTSGEEIETMIKARTFNLKQAGFKPNESLGYIQDKNNLIEKTIDNYNDLENLYVGKYITQLKTLSALSETLDIISKIDKPDRWKDEQWLEDINSQDPIAWAARNNVKIAEQDPVTWAIQNHKKIEGLEPEIWTLKQEQVNAALDSKIIGKEIEGKDPIFWARDNNISIKGVDPIA